MPVPAPLRRLLPGKLQHQVSALFALLFGVSMSLYTVYSAREQHALTESYLRAQAEALSRGLALSSQEALLTGEIWQLKPMLRQAAEFPGLVGIDLTDSSGVLLESVARKGDNTVPGLRAGFALTVPAQPREQVLLREAQGSAAAVEVWIPIGEDASLGWVRARFSLEQADASAERFYRDSLWSSLLAIAVMTLAFALFLRRPMRGLQAATEFATRLETSSGEQIAARTGVSDVDALSEALNKASSRLQAQQTELRRSEAHYRAVVEGLSEIVFETDSRTALSYLNPAWGDVTLRDPRTSLGQALASFVVGQDQGRLQQAMESVLGGRSANARERVRVEALDATVRWLEVSLRPLRDESGHIVGLLGWAGDATARVQAEQALTAQLRFVETLVDCMPNAVYVRHGDGRFLALNRAFEALFGVGREGLIGRDAIPVQPGSPMAEAQQALGRFEAGEEESGELSLPGSDGAPLSMLCHKAVLRDRDSVPGGLVVSITDISDRKRAEEQMRAARDAAEAASRAKSDFLANISHEIRTPMNAILGMTQLTLETPLSKEQRDYLSLVKHSADSLLSVLNDVLDFSKIEAGQLNFETIAFSFGDCLRGALGTLNAQAADKGVRLDMEIAPEVPDGVVGDPERLRQVLLNLLSNAVKFTSEGEVHVMADVLSRMGDALCVRIAVSDTGIGIPPEQHRSIFEAFAQADTSTSRKYGGTGLGLSISARLVAGMGGRIWLESEPGRGSTFFFTIRLGVAADLPRPAPSHPPFQRNSRSLRLLLAEDNPANQTLATRLLGKLGHTVDVVDNGARALAAAREHAYDAVLMDVQMPEMSGLDATRAIRAYEAAHDRPAVPIVAMTAHAMADDRARCLEAGMNAYITKPIVIDALVAELERIASPPTHSLATPTQPAPPSPASASPSLPPPPLSQEHNMSFNRAWMLEQIGGDVELMHDVIRVFMADYPRLIENLRHDFASGELGAIQSSAHALKGAVGNFGAQPPVASTLALEQAARQGQREHLTELLAKVETTTADLLRELEQELAAHSAA